MADTLFVKVCGITRLRDAELAAELGASAVGFIFWPGSPRYIPPERAAAIVSRMPEGLTRIGVFVDQPESDVRQAMDVAGLSAAQLHGAESPAYCRSLARPAIKAFGLGGNEAAIDDYDAAMTILLDAHDPIRRGGTGRVVDWELARAIAGRRRSILSGGLRPDNVARAVETVRPYGVDVSSGVESSPGIKEERLMRSFFEALHG